MRNKLMLACCLLAIPLDGSIVNIRPPRVLINSFGGVRAACKGLVDTACTRFDGTTLDCSCAVHRGRWSPIVRIDAQPRMYVSNNTYVLHELSHVFDFVHAMRVHADAVESRSFDSLDACDEFLNETLEGFDDALFEFRRASMLLRDHQLGNLCTSPTHGVADGPAPPATRRADGGCGSISTPLVPSLSLRAGYDATASPPPRGGDLDTQSQSAPRAGLVQRFPDME